MTANELLSSFVSNAMDLEKEGQYGEAGYYYALRAFAGVFAEDFRHTRVTRLSLAYTLSAVVCDVQADNYSRSKRLVKIFEPIYQDMIESAEDAVLAGLFQEWFGDIRLVLGDTEAREYYYHAKQAYESQPNAGQNWAFEEEFDRAYWAFEAFMESEGRSLPDNLEYNFHRRIEFKLNLVSELLTE